MAIDQKILEELKAKLLEEKKRLEEDLNKFAKPVNDKGDFETQIVDVADDDGDMDEEANQVEEYIGNLGVEQSLETQLKEVLVALEKMENGTYGLDEVTGEVIDLARLRVYPAAKNNVVK